MVGWLGSQGVSILQPRGLSVCAQSIRTGSWMLAKACLRCVCQMRETTLRHRSCGVDGQKLGRAPCCLAWAGCKLRPFWSAAVLPVPGAIVRLSRPLMEICHGRGKGGGIRNFDLWTSSERVTLQALGLDIGPA
jgi:hypothetical protein